MNILSLALAIAIGIRLAPHLGVIGQGILWIAMIGAILTAGSLFLDWYDSTTLGQWLNGRVMGPSRY